MPIKYINNGKKILTNSSRRPVPTPVGYVPPAKIAIKKKKTTNIATSGNTRSIIKDAEPELPTIKELTEEKKTEEAIVEVEESTEEVEAEESTEEEEVEEVEENKTSHYNLKDINIKSRRIIKAFKSLNINTPEELLACDEDDLFSQIPSTYMQRETFDQYIENAKKLLK